MRVRVRGVLLTVGFALASSACALLSKHDPLVMRYFTAHCEPTSARLEGGPRPAAPARTGLRLGRISAVASLQERIAYRTSDTEIHYYETRRWSERPDAYLQRALSQSLFEQHGLTMILSGAAPTLQVELNAFEEVKVPPHRARAQVTMLLHDGGQVLVHETLRVEKLVRVVTRVDEPEAVALAFSGALDGVVELIAERSMATVARLSLRDVGAISSREGM